MSKNLANKVKVSEKTIDRMEQGSQSVEEASKSLSQNKMATLFMESILNAFERVHTVKKSEFDTEVQERASKQRKGEKVGYVETSLLMKKNEGYLLAYEEIQSIIRGLLENQEKPVKSVKKPRKAKVAE